MPNSSMDAFVSSIRGLYHPTSGVVNHIEIYNMLSTNTEIFTDTPLNVIDNVLPVFPLPEFTLPHLFVLHSVVNKIQLNLKAATSSNAPNTNATTSAAANNEMDSSASLPAANPETQAVLGISFDRLLGLLESAIQLADENQIEIAIEVYSELCHFYTSRLCSMAKPVRGIPVIKTAISKIQLDVGGGNIRVNLLTAVHTDLLQLSLASMNFTPGLELLSHDILDIHKPANSHFDAKYLLSFFYYAGCLYAAVKDFEQALFYFEQVLTVPATCLSHIMIEAYKKLLVISLMSEGKIPVLPKYTSRIVLNQIKPICSVYLELAHAFLNYEQAKLTFLRLKHFETFAQDQMTGLVKQLEQSLYKKNIQKLTKTYITLSLEGMAEKVKLGSAKEAEHLMLNMIKDGEIFAKINQKDGMVSFHDNPEKYDNPAVLNDLIKKMNACIQMDSQIKAMDKEITTHPHYIQKCQSNSAKVAAAMDDEVDPLYSTSNSFRQAM